MTQSEFLEQLARGLARNNISDASDIVGEYEQHFAFKLADGFSEEEIAAMLGDPAGVAAQFGSEARKRGSAGGRLVAGAGLCLTGLAAGMFFILLAAWGLVLAVFSLCCAAMLVSLIVGLSPWPIIPPPPMPYGSAVTFGIAMAGLSVLAAVGFVWFMSFLRQMARAYGRFHHNTMAASVGKPVLPSVPIHPSFQPKTKRRLRRSALVSLSVFAAFSVLGTVLSMLLSGSLEFWHAWGWFV